MLFGFYNNVFALIFLFRLRKGNLLNLHEGAVRVSSGPVMPGPGPGTGQASTLEAAGPSRPSYRDSQASLTWGGPGGQLSCLTLQTPWMVLHPHSFQFPSQGQTF